MHAIGDRGNRVVLDNIEKALAEHPVEDHRIRVEHAQIVALEDIPGGIYFYRLEAFDMSSAAKRRYVLTKKAILLK